MLRSKIYDYISLGSTTVSAGVQIGPRAHLDLTRHLVRVSGRMRPATLGDLHRAALLVRWALASQGCPVLHRRGRTFRRVVDEDGMWAIEIISKHNRRVLSWA